MWICNGIPRGRLNNVRVHFQQRSHGPTGFRCDYDCLEPFMARGHKGLAHFSRKAIIDSKHGGGTSITTTPMRIIGIFQWIVLWLTLGDAPVSSSTQWTTLISKHNPFVFQIPNSLSLDVFHIYFLRWTKHDYVKANIHAKLLWMCTFGRLELLTFMDLISPTDYKAYKKTKEIRPTWYNLTVNVFVKFFYNVWFMYSIFTIFQPRQFPYWLYLLTRFFLQRDISVQAEHYRETTLVAKRSATEIWNVMTKAQERMIKSIRARI
jgi:hypothetical protein